MSNRIFLSIRLLEISIVEICSRNSLFLNNKAEALIIPHLDELRHEQQVQI